MIRTWCICGRHYSGTTNQNVYEKVNPKTRKIVKSIKGSCSICQLNKNQISTMLNDKRRRIFLKKQSVQITTAQLSQVQHGVI